MPGGGNSYLRVERSNLEDSGMRITSAAKGIAEAVANAARRINALDGNWEGMSNQNFMPEFNQSRTRAAAVSDGLTRLGKSLQEIGGTYEDADNVPVEFDMNIEQDASGKTSLSYSFLDGNSGEGAHAYNQFNHNGDGSVAVDMQEVAISADGQAQMSHVRIGEENFNMDGHESVSDAAASGELPEDMGDKFSGTSFGAMADAAKQTSPSTDAGKNFGGTSFAAMGEATGQIGKDGEMNVPSALAGGGSDNISAPGDGLLERNVQSRLGMDPSSHQPQSLEERVTELNQSAGDVLGEVKNGEAPTNVADDSSTPRYSGGGGGSQPMQMSALPPLQQPQSQLSADMLKSAGPPEGYKEGDSLAEQVLAAMAMDEMMDDSPLNRMGGGGGFTGDAPQGVGTMDLTDSMQKLDFPGQEVNAGAPELDTDPIAANPLEGVEQDFFEEPREMNIKNVNPRDAKKD